MLMSLHSDKVHLNVAGTKKLLSNIDAVHRVTKTATHTANRMSARGFRQSRGHLRPRGYGTMPRTGSVNKYCYICARSGHDTQECWFNARSTPDGHDWSLVGNSRACRTDRQQFATGSVLYSSIKYTERN